MATKKEFRTYMEQNKANLNIEALRWADMNTIYNEWKDTWSISKNYMTQPNPITTQNTPTQDNITTNKMVDSWLLPENQREIYPQSPTQDQQKIATGNFSASEARQYNQMTWNQQGARDVTSQQWVQNVTPAETAKIAQAGITNVWKWVKADLQSTWITKDTNWKDIKDKTPANLEQLVEARYGTIATQNPDWSITAIIGDKKYQWILDSALNPIKTEVQLTQAEKYKQSILNKYANAWVDTLYNAFGNWQIPSDMQWDLMWNPNFTLAKEKYDKKLSTDATNSQMENVYNTMTWKEITVVDKWLELNNKLVDLLTWMWKTETDLVSFRDYMAQNYPDIVSQSTDLNAKNKRLKELSEIANKNLRDIESKYPWLSKWSAILLANKQNEVINDEIRTLQFDIAELSSNIQFQTNQANQDYNYMQEQQARKDALLREQRWMTFNYLQWEQAYQRGLEAEQRGLEAEQRQREFQMQTMWMQREFQLEDRAYNEALQTRQLEQQYAYEYGDLNSENPTLQNIAIERAVAWMYKNYPIPGMESQATKVQKVKNLMAQWMTGTQAIAQVENEIRNSQRYKDYLAYEKARITPQTETKFWFMNAWDWIIAVTNPSTWKITFQNAQWQPTSWWPTWDYYSQFRVTQDVWVKSPNSKDTWYNGWTPWIDFAMPVWTDVVAITWWEVVKAWSYKDYWTQIVVRDSQWNEHMYSHLSKWLYIVWDTVNAWEVIAKSWNTWFSTWPHLDYRVKDSGWKWVDPKQFLWGPAWWEYTTTQKAIMDTYLKNPASKQNIDALKNAWLTTNDIESYKTITAWLWILWVPLSYERGIKNMIPATLMNSEVELAQLNETIKAMAKAWLSQEEAALTHMWFDVDAIKEKGNMDLALKTIDVARALSIWDEKFKNIVSSVNNFLKRWEEWKAVQTIEIEAQRELKKLEWDNYVSDSQVNFSKQVLDKLQWFIAKNSNKIWPISWRFSDLSKKFKNDPDYQALTTLLQGSLAEIRRAFAGTAVTEIELKAIRDFVWLDTKMPIQNLQSALNTNFESMFMNYNTQRQFAWLPKMTPKYIWSNWNERVNLYKWINATTPWDWRWQSSQSSNTWRWQSSQ